MPKNRQTRDVPLNEEAVNTLHRWREQSGPGAHIFDVATGFRSGWKELLKRGVPLNTVRDLLGHSSVQM
jgi:integrase